MGTKYKTHAQRQKQKRINIIAIISLAVLLVAVLIWNKLLNGSADTTPQSANETSQNSTETDTAYWASVPKPITTITMQNGEKIVLELYPDKAPNTVANFVELANSGFYDGIIFHRVVNGFVIQGGDPEGTGRGGPGYHIKGEFANNGFTQNDIKHERGVISMARSKDMDSAGSQFFIMHEDAPNLDGAYAAFGRVIEGIEVVDAIASVATRAEKPVEPQVIESIRVDTSGVTYSAEKIK